MTIAGSMLPEFNHEMGVTRQVLERVPEEDAAWKPHPKSYSLGNLATHLATIPSWIGPTLEQPQLDFAAPESARHVAPEFTSTANLLARFDANVARAREQIAAAPDAAMTQPWTLRAGAHEIFTLPRTVVMRSFIMNHMIHHRAQLTVYLRLREVPLPSVYGPTADMVPAAR